MVVAFSGLVLLVVYCPDQVKHMAVPKYIKMLASKKYCDRICYDHDGKHQEARLQLPLRGGQTANDRSRLQLPLRGELD